MKKKWPYRFFIGEENVAGYNPITSNLKEYKKSNIYYGILEEEETADGITPIKTTLQSKNEIIRLGQIALGNVIASDLIKEKTKYGTSFLFVFKFKLLVAFEEEDITLEFETFRLRNTNEFFTFFSSKVNFLNFLTNNFKGVSDFDLEKLKKARLNDLQWELSPINNFFLEELIDKIECNEQEKMHAMYRKDNIFWRELTIYGMEETSEDFKIMYLILLIKRLFQKDPYFSYSFDNNARTLIISHDRERAYTAQTSKIDQSDVRQKLVRAPSKSRANFQF